jgi:hypothetical protein
MVRRRSAIIDSKAADDSLPSCMLDSNRATGAAGRATKEHVNNTTIRRENKRGAGCDSRHRRSVCRGLSALSTHTHTTIAKPVSPVSTGKHLYEVDRNAAVFRKWIRCMLVLQISGLTVVEIVGPRALLRIQKEGNQQPKRACDKQSSLCTSVTRPAEGITAEDHESCIANKDDCHQEPAMGCVIEACPWVVVGNRI